MVLFVEVVDNEVLHVLVVLRVILLYPLFESAVIIMRQRGRFDLIHGLRPLNRKVLVNAALVVDVLVASQHRTGSCITHELPTASSVWKSCSLSIFVGAPNTAHVVWDGLLPWTSNRVSSANINTTLQ